MSDPAGTSDTVTPVLETRAVTKHYAVAGRMFAPVATVRALEDVSLALAPGRTLAIVGESGCGKSTLARQVAMLETPTSGQVVIGGVDATAADAATRRTLRRSVQMVFQNPFASLNPRKKIGLALEEPLAINTTLSRAEREAQGRATRTHVPCSRARRGSARHAARRRSRARRARRWRASSHRLSRRLRAASFAPAARMRSRAAPRSCRRSSPRARRTRPPASARTRSAELALDQGGRIAVGKS